MKKLITMLVLCFAALIIIVGGGSLIYFKTNEKMNTPEVDNSSNIATELKTDFLNSLENGGLPTTSVLMADSYSGKEDQTISKDFTSDPATQKRFYLASTIKPLFLSAVFKIEGLDDINTPIPFKFIKNDSVMEAVAKSTFNYLAYGQETDDLVVKNIVPLFAKDKIEDLTPLIIKDRLENDPKLKDLTIPLKNIIASTLGPSSNLGLQLMKDELAINKFNGDIGQASTSVEDYINGYLKIGGMTTKLRLNQSNDAQDEPNVAPFNEIEYLFQDFYDNKFGLSEQVWASMKDAMESVAPDPENTNQTHEVKSIAKPIFSPDVPFIREKTGYIGLDLGVAPNLDKENGWADLPKIEGKRIVIFNASSFTRIYLKNGNFVQFNYVVAVPVYLSLDPQYEEVNQDYLTVKSQALTLIRKPIGDVLSKYKDDIQTITN